MYKRNSEKVLSCLKNLPNGSTIFTKKVTIQFPVRYQDIRLAVIGEHSYVYGLFAIIVDGEYALLNVNCYVELGKANIEKVVINNAEYYNFVYEPGDVVFLTNSLVARSNLIFLAIDNFIFLGKVPWYCTYDDVGKLFNTAASYAGTKARMTPAVMQFMAGYIGRYKDNRAKFIREVVKKKEDFTKNVISWVPLRSVFWSAPGTVNKLSGAYFNDGIVSALNNPSNRVETVESILRA